MGRLGLLPLVDDGQRGLLLLLLALQSFQRTLEALIPSAVGRYCLHLHISDKPSNSDQGTVTA